MSIGESARPGDVYALDGGLGAGKTVLTQGIARGLMFTGPVTSPTFTILQVHEGGRLPLYHFDMYRLSDEDELYATGADEYLTGQGVCVVEWPTRVSSALPEGRTTWIRMERGDAPDERIITIEDDMS